MSVPHLRLLGWLFALGLGFWAAARLAAALVPEAVFAFDRLLILAADHLAAPWLDMLMLDVTALGARPVGAAILLGASGVLWTYRDRAEVLFLWAAFLGSIVLTGPLKALLGRPRPDVVGWRVPYAETAAFPSGHAVSAMVVFGGLAWTILRLRPERGVRALTLLFAVTAILLVGVSRVYLAVHYPSDVIGGYLLGGAWLAACGRVLLAGESGRGEEPGPARSPSDARVLR